MIARLTSTISQHSKPASLFPSSSAQPLDVRLPSSHTMNRQYLKSLPRDSGIGQMFSIPHQGIRPRSLSATSAWESVTSLSIYSSGAFRDTIVSKEAGALISLVIPLHCCSLRTSQALSYYSRSRLYSEKLSYSKPTVYRKALYLTTTAPTGDNE